MSQNMSQDPQMSGNTEEPEDSFENFLTSAEHSGFEPSPSIEDTTNLAVARGRHISSSAEPAAGLDTHSGTLPAAPAIEPTAVRAPEGSPHWAPEAREPEDAVLYDMGYRRYMGPRRNTSAIVRALIAEGLRSMFGVGRKGFGKWLGIVTVVTYLLFPFAIAALNVQTGEVIFGAETLFSSATFLPLFFLSLAAPTLITRDQQNNTLPLYQVRGIGPSEYAFARFISLSLAFWIILWVGQVILFVSLVGIGEPFLNSLRTLVAYTFLTMLYAFIVGALTLLITALVASPTMATAIVLVVFVALSGIAQALESTMPVEEANTEQLIAGAAATIVPPESRLQLRLYASVNPNVAVDQLGAGLLRTEQGHFATAAYSGMSQPGVRFSLALLSALLLSIVSLLGLVRIRLRRVMA